MRACPTPGKLSFKTRNDARAMHKRVLAIPGARQERLRPYLCPCGRWHLTKQTLRARRSAA